MPHFCSMDDGWPKKRCKVTKDKLGGYKCRHWLKGVTKNGCGNGYWKVTAKDGSCANIIVAPEFAIKENKPIMEDQ